MEKGKPAAERCLIAAAELKKIVRIVESAPDMTWGERWRWLHRIKGVVLTVRACVGESSDEEPPPTPDEAHAAEAVISGIQGLRSRLDAPQDMNERWAELKAALHLLM